METYLAIRCGDRICEDGISNVFWGFLILMALVVCCLLAWKAIEKLRGGARRTYGFNWQTDSTGPDPRYWEDMEGMNQRDQEQYLLIAGTRKERKAFKKRREAEQAQQKQSKT